MTVKHTALHCERVLDFSIEIYDPLLVEDIALVLRLGLNVVLPSAILKCED